MNNREKISDGANQISINFFYEIEKFYNDNNLSKKDAYELCINALSQSVARIVVRAESIFGIPSEQSVELILEVASDCMNSLNEDLKRVAH